MKFYSTCHGADFIARTTYPGLPKDMPVESYEAGEYRYCWAQCSKCEKKCNLSVTKNKFIRWIKINLKM